jgi:hypothetical protein
MRLTPTNAVNSSHMGLTKCAKARLVRIIVPARIRIAFSVVMSVRVWVLGSGELEAYVMQEENERLARRLPHFLAGLY